MSGCVKVVVGTRRIKWKGSTMREHMVDCSERVVLECRCGERLVLLGRATDWYSEDRLAFACECGNTLTFADRLEEEPLFPSTSSS